MFEPGRKKHAVRGGTPDGWCATVSAGRHVRRLASIPEKSQSSIDLQRRMPQILASRYLFAA